MTYSLRLRPRALAELVGARERYARLGHADGFLQEVDRVLEAIGVTPLRFPIVHAAIRRALPRRYPFAIFFRIRPMTSEVIVLAVYPQRADPAKWLVH